MKKKDFIKELKENLKRLEAEELKEIISDYEEHFDIGIEEGREEHEISKALGKPKTIAKQIVAHHYVKKAKTNKTPSNIIRAILAVLGLSFFNLIFVLGPVLGIFGGLLGLAVTGITLTLVGIIAPIAVLLGILEMGTVLTGGMLILIAMASAGILISIGTYYLTKLFVKLILMYLKFNVKIVGGTKDEDN